LKNDTPGIRLGFINCLQISGAVYVDAALFRGIGASANASRRGIKPNAKFVASTRNQSARLEITRRVAAGGEIFVSYADYWRSASATSYSTSNIPEWEWDLSDPFTSVLSSVPDAGDRVPPPILANQLPSPIAASESHMVVFEFVDEWPLEPEAPPVRGARAISSSSHICKPPEAPKPVLIPLSSLVASPVPAALVDEPISSDIARCLSPGPRYDGPTPDPVTMVWPLSVQPDWPISDAFRDFAFDTVVLNARPDSPHLCDDSFS
jgi:hypothetical protein